MVVIDTIDSFRTYIEEGAAARRDAIERLAAGFSDDEAQDYLDDNFADNLAELDVISALGNEFAIVGLYRVVEVFRGRILRARYGAASPNTAYIQLVRNFLLRHHGIDMARVPHHRAIDELRLLNNAIKHDAAIGWRPGGAELNGARHVTKWTILPSDDGKPFRLLGVSQKHSIEDPVFIAAVIALDAVCKWARIWDEWVVLGDHICGEPQIDVNQIRRLGARWLLDELGRLPPV